MINTVAKIKRFFIMGMPLLDLRIQIPFISVFTTLMVDALECMDRYYVAFQIKIWKWEFRFCLYDMLKRMRVRRAINEQTPHSGALDRNNRIIQKTHPIRKRLQLILYGFEHVLDGLLFNHIIIYNIKKEKDGSVSFGVKTCKWHPSWWLGYIRCVWLKDPCGAGYYRKKK